MVLVEVAISQISDASQATVQLATLVEKHSIRPLPISHQNALISVPLQSGREKQS